MIETKKDYDVFLTKGKVVGRVNGLAVFGDGSAGSIIPIEAAVSPSANKSEGRVIATGKLGEIAKEAGYTFDEMKLIIKKASGIEGKSFAECSKDELMLSIEACIQIGKEQFNINLS
jgi:Lon-like ATP-dependent protease